jgi:hypothetical protein
MDLLKETHKTPKLVNLENYKNLENLKNILPTKEKGNTIVTSVSGKWNLNKLLFVLFVLFLIFFLYNCKYGMFKSIETEPLPYMNSLI